MFFPCGSAGKESACNAGDLGSIPGLGRSPGEGKGMEWVTPIFRPGEFLGLYSPWNSTGQNTGVGSLSLLQGIFPIQRLNPGLPHCKWILYQLIHKDSPRILEWVACPFFSRSSWPRNQTGAPALQADSLPTELSGKPTSIHIHTQFFFTSYLYICVWGMSLWRCQMSSLLFPLKLKLKRKAWERQGIQVIWNEE